MQRTTYTLETYAPIVSVAMVGMFGTPSNDPRSAGFRGFASCSLKAFTRALALIDDMMTKYLLYSYGEMRSIIVRCMLTTWSPRRLSDPRMMSLVASPLVPRLSFELAGTRWMPPGTLDVT